MKIGVYGTLKKGFKANHLLDSSEYLGAFKAEIPFQMVNCGTFPALVPSSINHTISFEIYEVDNKTLKDLDYYEGYPTLYYRKDIPFQGMRVAFYYMPSTAQFPIVESGNWE